MPKREFTVAASGVRSGVTSHGVLRNDAGHRGLMLFVDVTATTGDATEDLAVRVKVEDPVTGNKVLYAEEASLFTDGETGTKVLMLYPGVTDAGAMANVEFQDLPIPEEFEIETEVLQGGPSPDFTYSIGAVWLP